MTPDETIDDATLSAFVDGELGEEDRLTVQRFLAANPLAAAQVMADMAAAHALRTAAETPTTTGPVLAAAQRLESALARPRRWGQLRSAAVLVLIFAAGWTAAGLGAGLGPQPQARPEFVDEALMSHRTALLRANMASQPEVAQYDPQEIRAATHIALPRIPPTWQVTDAQVFPSDEGPSVGLAFVTAEGPISLFAFRTDRPDRIPLTTRPLGRGHVAYWQVGELAYAVISPLEARRLEAIAANLMRSQD